MPSKKIYIIRHGQTDFNKNGIVQGAGVDSSLNETGRQQAKAFYDKYKGEGFEKVYVSGNVEFYILNTDFGYQLFQSQMEEPFAKLVKTGSENHFIYSTIQGQGIAYFDKDGNLTVEILNARDNSTSTKTYSIKN
jgi:bisphosphoglycerate-dependent phosphoglycerate mutase